MALVSYLAGASWNPYRYAGDWLHDFAVTVLVGQIVWSRSVVGLSKRSQLLYLILFVTRYLDLLEYEQAVYLVAHKLFFIGSSMVTCLSFCVMRATYEPQKDTCNVVFLALPTFFAACLFAEETSTLEVLWTFSEYLEALAMVPQYIFVYRDGNGGPRGIVAYMVCMGLYRSCYVLNWIHKKHRLPFYSDVHSWMGGAITVLFFSDYLLFHATGCSCLRRVALGADDGVHRVSREFQDNFGSCLLAPSDRIVDFIESVSSRNTGYVPVQPTMVGLGELELDTVDEIGPQLHTEDEVAAKGAEEITPPCVEGV